MLNSRLISKFKSIFIFLICFSCDDLRNHNVSPSNSAENNMFKITITADTDVATLTNTIPFEVKVKRKTDYEVRPDSRMIGTWVLHSLNINNQSQNISQFPTSIEFYEDSAYSRIITNTVSNLESYYGGYWALELNNQLRLIEQGNETLIQVSFDTEAIFIPLDGFMVWEYQLDGQSFREVYQKSVETDVTIFQESISYLTVMSTGNGIIDGFTELAKEDIAISLDYNSGSSYIFKAVFTPGLDLDSDAITASLDSEDYGHLTVQLPITVRLDYD